MGHAGAAFNLGLLLEKLDRFAEAEAAYTQAIAMGDAGAAFNLGILLEKLDRFAEAEAAYTQAIAMGVAGAASNLGSLLMHSGDRAGASRAFRGLLKGPSQETCLEGLTGLAELLLSSGRYTVGNRALARGLELASQETNASKYIALRVLAYLHGSAVMRQATLIELHHLVTEGNRIPTWEFDLGIARAQADHHLESVWLRTLVDVLTDSQPVSALEEWPAWRAASGDDPDSHM